MGKASSSKKVARAARAGSTHKGPERRALGFPLAIGLVVVIGTSLVLYSRDNRSEAVPPTVNDHWHAAYGIWNCDHWESALVDAGPDTTGIHTHDDGIIHVHPFNSGSAGSRATLGKFFDMVGVDADNDSVSLPDGTVLDESAGCAGEPSELVLVRWPADDPEADPEILRDDFDDVRFREDREVLTVALVKEGEEDTVPRPESVPTLDNLSDVIQAPSATTTTAPAGDESTTTAPDTSAAPTTTGG